MAADHYINAAVSGGSDTGADWTNAWATLPATLVRGDTYWIADGQYGAYTFNAAESDTTSIMIRKATVARHGTETGWDNAYGDGQAEFTHAVSDSVTLWTFTTGNWIIDGGGRTTKTSGHGFKITRTHPGDWTGDAFSSCHAIYVSNGSTAGTIHNFRFSYIEVQGVKDEFHWPNNGVQFYFERGDNDDGGPENVTIDHCYSHDCDYIHIITGGSENWVVEHNYFHWNYALDGYMHSEFWSDYGSDNMILRYNEIWDIEGTAFLALMGTTGYQHDNWQIYGNVFGYSPEGIKTQDGIQNGIIANSTNNYTTNSVIYNNTFINIPCAPTSVVNIVSFDAGAGATGNAVRNNLVYMGGISGETYKYAGVEEDSLDYNTYFDVPFYTAYADSNEVHIQKGTGDPFTDLASGVVSLAQNTDPGTDTPYTTDALGVEYDVSGGWTRGAFAVDPGESGPHIGYVDRSKTEDGDGSGGDPWQSSQIAGSLEAGDTLYDITPTVTGANPLTIAVDSVTVKYKTGVGAAPTIVGGLEPLTEFVNLSTSVVTTYLLGGATDDSYLRLGSSGAYSWASYVYDAPARNVPVAEYDTGKPTYAMNRFPNIPKVTATSVIFSTWVTAATVTNAPTVKGHDSDNAVAPTDTTTAKAILDTLTTASASFSAVTSGSYPGRREVDITDIFNEITSRAGFGEAGAVQLVFSPDLAGSGYARLRDYSDATAYPDSVTYLQVTTGTASSLWAYALPEAKRAISAVYRDGALMTSVTLANLNLDTEYHINAAGDSIYVYGDGEGITADTYGPQLTISGNHCTVYGGVFVHGNLAGAIKVTGDAATIVNCVFDSSSVGISLLSGADTCVVKNNVFAVSDTALADNAAETTEDYNFNITGFDNTGLAGAHDGELAAWDTRYDAPESWRDLGTPITGFSYYGSAPEPGASELEALVVDTATFRRGYGVGRWGDALQKRWGGSPW
jgi:hypothetical protein